ncbi:hypothetical protein [Mycolicibacterium llatzerense]|uniref:hypothetical protein n=1 Tax=Mycolicibacterium llatzerense TaxID=280871 RepID=UPI0021B56361|nr:hypothetical protein [Mycolicibacterium llatzerense]MCT7373386.1 hypothetical protein [Mycolicibacterium llatzerense]
MSVNWGELDNAWAFGAVVALVVGNYLDRRRGRNRSSKNAEALTTLNAKVDIVKSEVKNDHPDDTNLRDDLDHSIRIGEANAMTNTRILDVLGKLSRDLGDLRTYVGVLSAADRAHVADRDAFEKRVRDFVEREFPGAGPL